MKCVLSKLLLAFCFMMFTMHVNAQQRYYCEVKGIEKEFTSGLKIIFDFGTETSYNLWGDLSSKLKFVDEKRQRNKLQQYGRRSKLYGKKRLGISASLFFHVWRPSYNSLDIL